MEPEIIIAVVVALLLLAIIVAVALRTRRRKELQSHFGSEYDRTVDQSGSKRKAERELQERAHTRDQLDLRDLTPAQQERFRQEWQDLQAGFVDRPETALADADRLVTTVMRERGYPVDDFEQQAGLVSVDHPGVVEHYRAAHDIHERNRLEQVSTEEQRRAVVHYRALFDELMSASKRGRHEADEATIDVRDQQRSR